MIQYTSAAPLPAGKNHNLTIKHIEICVNFSLSNTRIHLIDFGGDLYREKTS
jgi:hypothetical protein